MRIGYACLTVGVRDTNYKSCQLKNISEDKLNDLIDHNLHSLQRTLDYNLTNNILLFRISSDLIPFGSSPANTLRWWETFADPLSRIGSLIKSNGMRVSMHPGQYTVINSPRRDVVERAILDLEYHNQFLNSLELGTEHKIVLHVGGHYNNKKDSIQRFIEHYRNLSTEINNRLVLENDDVAFNISDVLDLGAKLNLPVVFDNLHHQINPCNSNKDIYGWIDDSSCTWAGKDGPPKIHYSQQNPGKKRGSHADYIRYREFMDFYEGLSRTGLDIMLEVKDKNLSAVKCINCTSANKIKALEDEWSRYKYYVLEKSPAGYQAIRMLLNNKREYPVYAFYDLLEDSARKETNVGNGINAALHVWGYFKKLATPREKETFTRNLEAYNRGEVPINRIKAGLLRLSVKYEQAYLLDSLYFYL